MGCANSVAAMADNIVFGITIGLYVIRPIVVIGVILAIPCATMCIYGLYLDIKNKRYIKALLYVAYGGLIYSYYYIVFVLTGLWELI